MVVIDRVPLLIIFTTMPSSVSNTYVIAPQLEYHGDTLKTADTAQNYLQ